MLKQLAVAALAFVAIMAAAEVDAQPQWWYDARHDRAMAQIKDQERREEAQRDANHWEQFWREERREQDEATREHLRENRRFTTESRARYGYGRPIPHPSVRLSFYVMGYRYPEDSCAYSWNPRNTCVQYADPAEWEGYWQEHPETGERYARRTEEPAPNRTAKRRENVPQATDEPVGTLIVMNLTGCPASINGTPIPDEGLEVPEADKLFAKVTGTCPNKHFKPLGGNRIGLKCQP